VLELKKAAFDYAGKEILTDMSVTLAPGTFHFLTGPSGSGKTTFLKLCYQDLIPSSGTLHIFGKDVRAMDRDDVAAVRQRIGVVHQDCQFLDHLTMAENILLPLQVTGHEVGSKLRDMQELMVWTGLADQMDLLPPVLSGGERQRAALARAVIMSPDLIIADEPTGNLDWDMAQRVLTLLIELNKMGKTILIATHDMNLIRMAKNQIAARVLRIRQRHLELAGAEL
jgi:cell division transport system ATP-binding protein